MGSPTPTLINLDNTDPAPPGGSVNVKWQASAPYSQSVQYGGETIQVAARNVSGYVPAPGTGGTTVAVVKLPLAPSGAGNFTVPHHLGFAPNFVVIEMQSGGNIWLQTPLSFDSTNLYLVASDAGITATACMFLSGPDAAVPLAPSSGGDFSTAHGLSAAPDLVVLQMTSGGFIWFQTTGWDATDIYGVASDGGVTALAYCWLKIPIIAVTGYAQLALAPTQPGNFTVAHGLGQTPNMVLINMTSGGNIWQQSVPYDATNLYLVASDAGITADAEVWVG